MACRLQNLSSRALNNIAVESESDYDTDEVEASRLQLTESTVGVESLGSSSAVTRPKLPELTIADTSSGSDPELTPIGIATAATANKLSANQSEAHKGRSVHRRKKKSSSSSRREHLSDFDFDKTPTQDAVNNGIFVVANGDVSGSASSPSPPSSEGAPPSGSHSDSLSSSPCKDPTVGLDTATSDSSPSQPADPDGQGGDPPSGVI